MVARLPNAALVLLISPIPITPTMAIAKPIGILNTKIRKKRVAKPIMPNINGSMSNSLRASGMSVLRFLNQVSVFKVFTSNKHRMKSINSTRESSRRPRDDTKKMGQRGISRLWVYEVVYDIWAHPLKASCLAIKKETPKHRRDVKMLSKACRPFGKREKIRVTETCDFRTATWLTEKNTTNTSIISIISREPFMESWKTYLPIASADIRSIMRKSRNPPI
jgi:hypothetical protein